MPTLTIGRMAKLYGLHRSTLYEAIERGRITAGLNEKGQRVVDLSEMIRVYGEATGRPDTPARHPTPPPPDTPDTAQAMLEELRLLRAEVAALRQELRLLPAPRVDKVDAIDGPEPPQEPRKADTPADDTRSELRALVNAMRRSER